MADIQTHEAQGTLTPLWHRLCCYFKWLQTDTDELTSESGWSPPLNEPVHKKS